MLNQYKRVNILYEQLDQIQFNMLDPFILDIEWNSVHFEFLIRIKNNSSNVLVFGSGAGGFQEQTIGPPIFHRHSWMGEFEDHVIYYNDPTLYLGKIALGWGQGTKNRFYLKDIATILMKIFAKLQVDHKNVLFYGSSGGGFMSLILAGFVKGSTALVNNPQTALTNWIPVPVNQVFSLSYPNFSREDIIEIFSDRIHVLNFYNRMKYIPNIYFLQNVACEFDVQNHLLPFISGLKKLDEDYEVNQIQIDLYYDKNAGHAAIGKDETIYYINKLLSSNNKKGVKDSMKLSVIIFCEAGETKINRLLEKVNYLQPLEIIIVTNNKAEINKIITKIPGCNIVILEEKDNNKARVTGAKAAKGDILLFLEGHIVIFSVQLEQFLQPILNKTADVIVNNIDSSLLESRKMDWPDVCAIYRQVLNDVLGRDDLKIDSLSSMPSAITKKAIEDIGYENLVNPTLAQIRLMEKGWRIIRSSSITINPLDNYPLNQKTSYQNKLTQVEKHNITNYLQIMSEWLYKKGARGGYTDGGRKREVIEQLQKGKSSYFLQKGWGMHSSIHNGKQLSIIIPAQNEETTIEQVILEARKIEPKEIIVVINGSTDRTEAIAKQLGATVIVYKEALGHDVGRAIGALEATGDILLFIDADFSIPARDLHPLAQAVANGTDIALNDLNLNLRFPLYIVNVYKYMLNIACNRRDLGVGSLVAVPHAISRECLEGIGWNTLFTSCLAQAKAILKGYKVECVHYVDVMKPNRIRPSEHFASIGHPPAVLRIIGDHLEGISYLLKQKELQSFFLPEEGD